MDGLLQLSHYDLDLFNFIDLLSPKGGGNKKKKKKKENPPPYVDKLNNKKCFYTYRDIFLGGNLESRPKYL